MKHNKLEGRTIHFRLIEESDASFLYQLRMDETLNKYISKVDSSIEMQKEWIRNYKEREKEHIEYYFIIERNDTNEKIGTIRLYGITDDNRFCWGSWILNSRKTVTSAIESAYLIYE
ncbi:GNAT family N-acetyltransferase, partial [Citrobacter freundii]